MRVRALCCCRSTLAKSLGQYCLRRFLFASRSPIEREDAIKSALHIQEKSAPKIPSNAFMPAKRAKNLTLQKRRQWVLYLARERAPFSRLWSRPALLLSSCGFTSQSICGGGERRGSMSVLYTLGLGVLRRFWMNFHDYRASF